MLNFFYFIFPISFVKGKYLNRYLKQGYDEKQLFFPPENEDVLGIFFAYFTILVNRYWNLLVHTKKDLLGVNFGGILCSFCE
jgi:hypothetical protein